jgi:hypothetical protein
VVDNLRNLAWLNDEDTAINVLATVAVENRQRRLREKVAASIKKADLGKAFMDNVANPVGDAMSKYVVDPMKSTLGSDAAKHVGYGLVGAGLGAGTGLASQMMVPEKKRRTLSSMLTGGLMGGALGAGGSLMYDHGAKAVSDFGKPSPPEQAAHLRAQDEAATATGHSGPHNPQLDASVRPYRMSPESVADLDRAKTNVGRDAAYASYLNHATRNAGNEYGRFTLPADHPSSADLGHMETPIEGLDPKHLRGDDAIRAAYSQKVLDSYKTDKPIMRTISEAGKPDRQVPWTARDLQSEMPRLTGLAGGKERNYQWAQPQDETQRNAAYGLLDELTEKAQANPQRDQWTSGTQAMNLWNRGQPGAAAARLGRMVGLGAIPGVGPKSDGLFPEIGRALTPNVQLSPKDMAESPAFASIRAAGLDPAELINAYKGGPAKQDEMIARYLREGRQGGLSEADLRSQLPDLTRQALEGAGAGADPSNSFAWGSLADKARNMPSWGMGVGTDALTATAAVDAAGSGVMKTINTMRGGNPNDIARLIAQNPGNAILPGLSGDNAQQASDYIRAVHKAQGNHGLAKLFNNPMGQATGVGMGGPIAGQQQILPGAHNAVAAAANVNAGKVDLGTLKKNLEAGLTALGPTAATAGTLPGGQVTVADARRMLHELSRIEKLDPTAQRAALESMLGGKKMEIPEIPAPYKVPKVELGTDKVNPLAAQPTAVPGTGVPTSPAQIDSMSRTLSKALDEGKSIPGIADDVAAGLKRLPEAQRIPTIAKLLSDPKAQQALGPNFSLNTAQVKGLADKGRDASKGLLGFLSRPFAGGMFSRIPGGQFASRGAVSAAVPLAAHLALGEYRPGVDRIEDLMKKRGQ